MSPATSKITDRHGSKTSRTRISDLDRIEQRMPEAPGETGRLMIWVRDRSDAGIL